MRVIRRTVNAKGQGGRQSESDRDRVEKWNQTTNNKDKTMQKASNTQTEKINPPSGRCGANLAAYT